MFAILSAIALVASAGPEVGIGGHGGPAWASIPVSSDQVTGTTTAGLAGVHVDVRFALSPSEPPEELGGRDAGNAQADVDLVVAAGVQLGGSGVACRRKTCSAKRAAGSSSAV